jgi:hypothetical protein
MDEDGYYVELYFYDKLSSFRPSDMSDPSVKHVWGTRFDSIRHETCMILRGIYSLILPTVAGTRPIIPGTRPIVACTRLIVACNRPIVACTRLVVEGTDPEFTRFIDLVQLGWIHRHLVNYSTQNRSLYNFTSQWCKGHKQLILYSGTIIRL